MHVRITRDTFIGGKPAKAGTLVDVSEIDGRNLISGGKAMPADKAPKAAANNRAKKGEASSTRSDGASSADDDGDEAGEGDGGGDGA